MTRLLAVAAACLVAAACATTPESDTGGAAAVTPSRAVESMPQMRGERVQWGGRIVSVVNKARSTEIEVQSYPLARAGFPNISRRPTGRFVLKHDGFLEPLDYAPGRLITVDGSVDALVTTSVRETEFLVPLVAADQLRLWDEPYYRDRDPRFGFGLGISIGL